MLRNDEVSIYSTGDIVRTLAQYGDEDGSADAELAFASALTGISEDTLYEWVREEKAKEKEPGTEEYTVYYRLSARYAAHVDAKNPEEAVSFGDDMFTEADFGEASDIDGEAVFAEDSSGRRVWERKKGGRKW